MWIGEQIDEYGIGNGISLLIMAGILAAMPGAGYSFAKKMPPLPLGGAPGGKLGIEKLLMLAAMFVAVVIGVVYITLGQRRIPMQSAKTRAWPKGVWRHATIFALKSQSSRWSCRLFFASSLLMLPTIFFHTAVKSSVGGWQLLRSFFLTGQAAPLKGIRFSYVLLLRSFDLLFLLLLDGNYV